MQWMRPPARRVWHFETDSFFKLLPAVIDDTIFIQTRDGNLYAVDAATGNDIFDFETGIEGYPSSAVADGTIFLGGSDGNLYAISGE